MVATTQNRHSWLNIVALILIFPALYVILISILKYGLGFNGPFDASAPVLEKWGIKDPVGWNINLLILLGPVAAVLISAFQVLHIQIKISKEQFDFHFSVARKWMPITIGLISCLVIATLFMYMAGENCNCH